MFTHDDVPLEVGGVQVPAGTIEPSETPDAAVVREVLEETGVMARVVASLGVERYDVWPSKPEVHERHFFQLEPLDDSRDEQWSAGECDPSDGGSAQRWTCQWIDLEQAHVLCAGFGARLGEISPQDANSVDFRGPEGE
ncbi:NUDIX domain-containing protein [Propionibacteriaceae bacterium Y1685]